MLSWWSVRTDWLLITFLLLTITTTLTTAQAREWLTVLAVNSNNSNANIYRLLMSNGPLNDGANKESLAPQALVTDGNFRSSLTDRWASISPTQIRVALHDEEGYLLWLTDFAAPTSTKNPRTWMTTPSIVTSTDRKLTSSSNMAITFDESKLEIRSQDNLDGRLLLTWDPNTMLFVLSAKHSLTPPPLSLPNYKSNEDMVLSQATINKTSSFIFSSGSAFWMFLLSANYLAGIGLRKNDSTPGELRQFLLQVALDPACYPLDPGDDQLYTTLCKPGTQDPIVFNATYAHGSDGSLAVIWFDYTVAAFCVKMVVLDATSSHYTGIYLYHTEYSVIEASTFAIQWWIDTATTSAETSTLSTCKVMTVCETTSSDDVVTAVTEGHVTSLNESEKERLKEEIQQTLAVDKQDTTKFKRQFISVPDSRPSAVLIGVIGVSVICLVILCVIILDFATITTQLKVMVSNLKHSVYVRSKARTSITDLNPQPKDCLQITDVDESDISYI